MSKIQDKKLTLLGLALIIITLGLSFYLFNDKLSWLPAQIAKLTSVKTASNKTQRLIKKSGLASKGDRIRIGLYNANKEIKLSSDGSFYIKVKGKSLASFKKNEIISVRFKKGKYYLKGPRGWKKTLSSYPRFIPKKNADYIQMVNFEARPSWNQALNDNCFRGIIEVRYNPKTKKTWVINELPLEAYLLGIAETSNRSHPEFQKALAIIARTYAQYVLNLGGKHKDELFHLNTTASDQVYKGYNFELRNPNFAQAVLSTCGKMVTYKGKIVVTPYFSRSDGRTRSWEEVWKGKRPWLVSVSDPACKDMSLLGHGVGLSGYGAHKMAEAGKKYSQILKYYYKGIRIKNFYSSKTTKPSESTKNLIPRIAVGPRSGMEPRINIFDSNGKKLKSFLAYHKNFRGGASIALGDVNGDGKLETVVGAGKGGGPHIRVFNENGKYTKWDVFAFHPNFKGGVDVACGDVDGDGIDEIGVCQAQAGQAWCKVYKYNKQRTIVGEWNAFSSVECGASIAMGDIDGDGKDEVIVGAGPGGGPHIRVFEANGKPGSIQFFAFHPNFKGGVDVTAGDVNGDGIDEIGVCQKASGEAWCKVYKYNKTQTILKEWRAYPQGIECGASISFTDVDKDGKEEIVTSPGLGYKPQIKVFKASSKTLNKSFLAFDKKFKQGTNVDSGAY